MQSTNDDDQEDDADGQLVQEFVDFIDRTWQYARSAWLTAEQRARVLKISTNDLMTAFDLDSVTVRRVQRLRRKAASTTRNKATNGNGDGLKTVVPQRIPEDPKTSLVPEAIRSDGVALTPRAA